MRTTRRRECRAIGALDRRASSTRWTGPVRFLIPEGGVSAIDAPGQPFHDPEADAALFDGARAALPRRRRRGGSSACRCTSTTRPSPTRWSPPGATSPRRRAPARWHERHAPHRSTGASSSASAPRSPRGAADHRRRRRHRPVGQVRGGRRHRPHRHLQLRPLPHGRARLARRPARLRQRQRDRLRDGARGAAGRQAHAGARRRQRHRPVHDRRRVPAAR